MQLERQLEIAVDESRLVIGGSRVLFGFQLNSCRIFPAVIVLMAPALRHRIAFSADGDPGCLKICSQQSEAAARTLAAFPLMTLLGFWHAYPLWRRAHP